MLSKLVERLGERLAVQLRSPSGPAGHVVASALNIGNSRTIEAAVRALSHGPDAVVGDLGFGGGAGLRVLLDRPGTHRVHGVDSSPTMVRRAERKFAKDIAGGRLQLGLGSITDLPLRASSLDGIVTVNTIYFVDDLGAMCREIARVLKVSGRVVIGFGDPEAMAEQWYARRGFFLRGIDAMCADLEENGLAIADHQRVQERPRSDHLLIATQSTPRS